MNTEQLDSAEARDYQRMLAMQGSIREENPLRPVAAPKRKRMRITAPLLLAAGGMLGLVVAAGLAYSSYSGTAAASDTPDVTAEALADQPIVPSDKVVLDEARLPFRSDSADLVAPDRAMQRLSLIGAAVKGSGSKITLTGTTATDGNKSGRYALSLARANTVRQLLVSLGVDPSQIKTVGVGIHYPSHIRDTTATGALIPAAAAKNRTVVLTVQ